jgi:hypothetical protein
VSEWRLFPEGATPDCSTADWYADRDVAPHLEQDGHRDRLALTEAMCRQAIDAGARSVCDLGAGDGGLLSVLPPSVSAVGFDLQPANVTAAQQRGVTVVLQDITATRLPTADLYVATEVLEHLIDPHRLVAEIPGRWLVASSPYTETDEAHYEHHLWAWDLEGYPAFLEAAGWRVLRQETAWICQVLLCEKAR